MSAFEFDAFLTARDQRHDSVVRMSRACLGLLTCGLSELVWAAAVKK